jgi:hypothetical protein
MKRRGPTPRYASGLMRPGEIPPAGLLADELVVDD